MTNYKGKQAEDDDSRAAPAPKYKLKFVPSAWKEWNALDGSIKDTFKQALRKRLDKPHVPGSELKGDLKGFYNINLRKQGYRLVYGVEDDCLVVMVMAVDMREDSIVYRSALSRLTEPTGEIPEAAKKSRAQKSGK